MNSACSEKQALRAPEAIAADVACDAAPSHSCKGNGVTVVRILFCEGDDINCCCNAFDSDASGVIVEVSEEDEEEEE